MLKQFRRQAVSCAAVLAMTPALAYAQPANADAEPADMARASADSGRDIVVTGSRIRQDGYNAPTPVTVLGRAEINAQKPANIADLVYTLPAVATGGITSGSSANSFSPGVFGINAVNLRGLGQTRTLVLLDGQRSVGSAFSGLVDVNTFPQDLIERVEVVTGGASAQYGSDAVGGVANFILNKKFKGLKLGADTGITTYGDGHNYRFTATAGQSFMDDRLHVLLNGEYFKQEGIDDSANRPWNQSGYQMMRNPAYTPNSGLPELLVGPGIGIATRHRGGIINSGPLRGTYFLEDGVAKQLNYGTFSSFSSPFMLGGDWQETSKKEAGATSLIPDEERIGVFNRVSFDVTPNVTVYGQFSWNRNSARANSYTDYGTMNIKSDNAYLLTQYPQIAAAMQANGLSSIPVTTSDVTFIPTGITNRRDVYRFTAGAEGKFSLFDRPWSWEGYYHHGVTKLREQTFANRNLDRFTLATDAVMSNGQIVCRSTLTDSANGCVPIDRLGTSAPSAESLAYIFGPEQPWREQTIKLDVAALNFSGELLDLPGGPVAIALGGEWRKEQVDGKVGETSSSGWGIGNFAVNRGKINVKEAFLEASLPLLAGFDVNAAGRYTDYSTSGSVQTWKIGATYSPISDIKFRGAYSHDIRAPNMQELFITGARGSNTVVLPSNSPRPGPVSIRSHRRGNPNLEPETANTLTAGFVVTPSFLPGLSASVDYYDINVKGAIGSVGLQQMVDFCYDGFSQFCDNLIFSGDVLTDTFSQPVNFAKQHLRGMDFEASYRTPMSAISSSLPGNFSIHAAISHPIKNLIDNLVRPVDYAGVIADSYRGTAEAMPNWVYRVSAFYEIDPVTINLVARGFSSGVYSNDYIECTSNCPTSTTFNRTIINNHIDGALYFDGSVAFKVPSARNETTLTLIVKNVFNRDPERLGLDFNGDWVTLPQTARTRYDTLGRVFRVALTTKF